MATRTNAGSAASTGKSFLSLGWAEEGLEAVRKVAKKSPEAFVAISLAFVPAMSGSRLNKQFLVE